MALYEVARQQLNFATMIKFGFFGGKSSDKNKAIATNKNMQLFFSHSGKGSYLVVNSEPEIIIDKMILEDL